VLERPGAPDLRRVLQRRDDGGDDTLRVGVGGQPVVVVRVEQGEDKEGEAEVQEAGGVGEGEVGEGVVGLVGELPLGDGEDEGPDNETIRVRDANLVISFIVRLLT
jgi:hypothetical protein